MDRSNFITNRETTFFETITKHFIVFSQTFHASETIYNLNPGLGIFILFLVISTLTLCNKTTTFHSFCQVIKWSYLQQHKYHVLLLDYVYGPNNFYENFHVTIFLRNLYFSDHDAVKCIKQKRQQGGRNISPYWEEAYLHDWVTSNIWVFFIIGIFNFFFMILLLFLLMVLFSSSVCVPRKLVRGTGNW